MKWPFKILISSIIQGCMLFRECSHILDFYNNVVNRRGEAGRMFNTIKINLLKVK